MRNAVSQKFSHISAKTYSAKKICKLKENLQFPILRKALIFADSGNKVDIGAFHFIWNNHFFLLKSLSFSQQYLLKQSILHGWICFSLDNTENTTIPNGSLPFTVLLSWVSSEILKCQAARSGGFTDFLSFLSTRNPNNKNFISSKLTTAIKYLTLGLKQDADKLMNMAVYQWGSRQACVSSA